MSDLNAEAYNYAPLTIFVLKTVDYATKGAFTLARFRTKLAHLEMKRKINKPYVQAYCEIAQV